jgi:micrococcal nuclease
MNRVVLLFVLAINLILTGCKYVDETGKVVGIADGDTFTMLDGDDQQVHVRLYGIDAPEKNQDYGQVSKKFLSDLIFNERVALKKIETDRYGRTIAIVTLDSIVVNEALLKAGLAWHYRQYDDNPYWSMLEVTAQSQGKGLWAKKRPIAPWTFRKQKRTERKKV